MTLINLNTISEIVAPTKSITRVIAVVTVTRGLKFIKLKLCGCICKLFTINCRAHLMLKPAFEALHV